MKYVSVATNNRFKVHTKHLETAVAFRMSLRCLFPLPSCQYVSHLDTYLIIIIVRLVFDNLLQRVADISRLPKTILWPHVSIFWGGE